MILKFLMDTFCPQIESTPKGRKEQSKNNFSSKNEQPTHRVIYNPTKVDDKDIERLFRHMFSTTRHLTELSDGRIKFTSSVTDQNGYIEILDRIISDLDLNSHYGNRSNLVLESFYKDEEYLNGTYIIYNVSELKDTGCMGVMFKQVDIVIYHNKNGVSDDDTVGVDITNKERRMESLKDELYYWSCSSNYSPNVVVNGMKLNDYLDGLELELKGLEDERKTIYR